MNTQAIQILFLKDLFLSRWPLFGYLVGGLLSAMVTCLPGESAGFIGFILIVTVTIAAGIHLIGVLLLAESVDMTRTFVMSLPVSLLDYSIAKISVVLVAFLIPWLGMLASLTVLNYVMPEAKPGVLAFLILLFLFMLAGFCLQLVTAVVTESVGWTIVVVVLGNVLFNLFAKSLNEQSGNFETYRERSAFVAAGCLAGHGHRSHRDSRRLGTCVSVSDSPQGSGLMAAASGDSTRIHYLDNLRALAMLLGVYLHGALAYAEPSRSVWIATNPQGNVAIDASIWWIHLFRMGLFFLLSGYFSKLVIQRKGLKPFLGSRGIRIALPFVLFWPLLMVAMTIVFVFALSYVKEPQGLMQLIVAASQDPEAAKSSTPYTTMHLWFLYYLLMFSLIAAVGSRWTRLKFRLVVSAKMVARAFTAGFGSWSDGGGTSHCSTRVLCSHLVAICLLRVVLLGWLAVVGSRVAAGSFATLVLAPGLGKRPLVRAPLLSATCARHRVDPTGHRITVANAIFA